MTATPTPPATAAQKTRYRVAREHFAKAQDALTIADNARFPEDRVAAAELAHAHLKAASFAKSWDAYYGGDLITGEPL